MSYKMEQSNGDTDTSLLSDSHQTARLKCRTSPIDRGWAWIVMLGCFCNYFILVGLLLSGGIFFVEFLSLYEASTSTTAIITGVQAGCISAGAFVSQNILLSFLHVRTIVMCGGFTASVGIILASFANSILMMVISYSMLTGFGIGMVLIPGLVLLGKYFNKRRAIATALSMVGVNTGGMSVPIFIRFLIDEYNLSGAFLIYGGIMLNSIVAGALLRPLSVHHKDNPEFDDSSEATVVDYSEKENGVNTNGIHKQHLVDIVECCSDTLKHGLQSIETATSESLNHSERGTTSSGSLIPQFRHRTFSESHNPNLKTDKTSSNVDLHFASTPSIICVSLPNLSRLGDDRSDLNHHDMEATSTEKPSSPCQRIRNILDFSLFKNPLFILLILTSVFGILSSATAAMYLPALAVSKGVPKQKTPILLTAVSASGIISRLLIGLFADAGCVRTHVLLITCVMCSGVTFFTVSVLNDFESLLIFCVSYGFFCSLYFSLMPVIVVDFLGLENMATCYGFIEIFQGTCLAASHPFIGWLCDMTGNYNLSYYFFGVSCFACAFCLSLEPIARRIQRRIQKLGQKH